MRSNCFRLETAECVSKRSSLHVVFFAELSTFTEKKNEEISTTNITIYTSVA